MLRRFICEFLAIINIFLSLIVFESLKSTIGHMSDNKFEKFICKAETSKLSVLACFFFVRLLCMILVSSHHCT